MRCPAATRSPQAETSAFTITPLTRTSDQLIDAAWTQLAPAVELGGVARDTGYEAAIQDALDAETAIAEAEAALENKRVTRDEKVAALAEKTALVINGVVGNPAYGPDSDLYGAMGYVRKSQRQSGLTQKSNVPPPTPPAPQ